jgi:hypothetical protein
MTAARVRTRGVEVSIGTTAATASSDTYTVIENCRAVPGALGTSWQMADSSRLSTRYTPGVKTVANAGSITLEGLVYEDAADGSIAPGQAALRAAAADETVPAIYNLKIAAPGAPVVYVKVQISSFTLQKGNSSNIKEFRATCVLRAAYTATAQEGPVYPASAQAARTAAAAILATASGGSRTSLYVNSTATGAATGTSDADAFTTLDQLRTALASASDGVDIYIKAPEAAPLTASASAFSTLPNNVVWNFIDTPWITGGLKGSWTALAAGIFSLALATEPKSVAYDLKRDDNAGTVTGINLDNADFTAGLAWGEWSKSDCVAWYGYLEKEAVATTTPAEGKWSHTGGVLYINPPGSPTLANVNALAEYTDGRAGIQFNATCNNHYLRGRRVFRNLATDDAGNGYAERFTAQTNCVSEGCVGIMTGYHTTGFVANSGAGNVILDNLTVGYDLNGIPLVFYSDSVSYSTALADRFCVIAFGKLRANGSPIDLAHQTRWAFSHTNGTRTISGIKWSRALVLDPKHLQEAKHSVTMTGAVASSLAQNTGATITFDNATTYPCTVVNSRFYGRSAFCTGRVFWDDILIEPMGSGSSATDKFSAGTNVESATSWQFYWRNVTYNTGQHRYVISVMAAGDQMYIDGCTINIQGTGTVSALINPTASQARQLVFKNTTFNASTTGSAIVTMNPTPFDLANWADNLDSEGGNTFGANLTAPVKRTNHPTTAAKTRSAVQTALAEATDTWL